MRHILVIGCDTQLNHQIGDALPAAHFKTEYVTGCADAINLLDSRPFDVVVAGSQITIEEGLTFLEAIRVIRPCVRFIFLADRSTPERAIAALRAKAFAFFTPPFYAKEIVSMVGEAANDDQWEDEIQILSARPGWVSVRVNCRLVTAERLMTFEKELDAELPENTRLDLMQALREIVLNAMEHGAGYDPEKVIVVTAVRTARALMFYVRDPGVGFRMESLAHAAVTNPPDNPAAHVLVREKEHMRPGGYGLLIAAGSVDELIYNEVGNEVLMIKYV